MKFETKKLLSGYSSEAECFVWGEEVEISKFSIQTIYLPEKIT